MSDTITRRGWLLAAIQRETAPVTTQRAVQILAASPWASAGRNTARKDLRALAGRGFLIAADVDGRRCYTPTTRKDGAR